VEGRLQTTSWEDKQSGGKKYRTEIVAQELVLLDARGEGASDNGGSSKGRGRSKKVEVEMASTEIESSDIPF
jgi:single-strand DNA-binding protein